MVGVAGTLNSSVSQSVQPILAQKNVLQISPANTNDTLTKGKDFLTAPKRQFETYFRTCTVDSLQGPYAANYLVTKTGKKSIAIITDGLTYGEGLADEFSKQAQKLGAKIVTREKIGEKDTDFSGVIAKIKPTNPDGVYFGGQYPQAGPLSKQLASQGLNVPVIGGDGIFDDKFIELGGKDGDLATSVGAPTESLASAKAFVDAYKAKGYKEAYSAYGAFAYDAANAIIGSLSATLNGGDWSDAKRSDLLKNVASYKSGGATGDIAFDQYGDSKNKVLTVYKVSGGKWAPSETGTFEG
jgi:branched-chain amino acid transport system substrate-binding protein